MVEVELVGGDEPAPGAPGGDVTPGPDAGAADGTTGTPPRRVRARTVVAGAAVLVAALAGTQAALDARDRDELARYAQVPGVLPPLGDGLEARWEPGLGDVLTMYTGAEVDGLSLGARFEASGAQSAVALDPATGDVRWSTPLRGPEELLVDATENLQGVPCDATTGESPLLVCVVGGRYVRPSVPPESYGGDTSLPTPVPQEAELVVLDATTGDVVRRAPERPPTGMVVVGGTVVTATSATDGSVAVRARDVRTGEVAWEQELPAGTAEREWAQAAAAPSLVPAGDTVLVVLGTATARFGPDGTLVGTTPASTSEVGAVVEPARGDRVVRRGFGVSGGEAVSLLSPDGTSTVLPEGRLRVLSVDDGTEPDVLLLTGAPDADGGLLAWDAGTGEVRWVVDDLLVSDAVVLGGVAYLVGFDRSLRAVELADGTTRWRTAPPAAAPGTGGDPATSPTLLTDGRSLVVVGRRTEATEAQAYALRDGRPTWAGTLPFAVDGVQPLGGRAVAWSRDTDRWTVLG